MAGRTKIVDLDKEDNTIKSLGTSNKENLVDECDSAMNVDGSVSLPTDGVTSNVDGSVFEHLPTDGVTSTRITQAPSTEDEATVNSVGWQNDVASSDSEGEEFMDEEGREAKSMNEKEKGNEAFGEGRYSDAIGHWSRSLRTCQYILNKKVYQEDAPQKKEVESIVKILNLNLAIGQNKISNFPAAIKHCNAVLADDPTNEKGLFRKADALFHSLEFKECLGVLELLLTYYPSNSAAVILKSKANQQEAKYKSRQKKMVKNMMSKMENDPRSSNYSSFGQNFNFESVKGFFSLSYLILSAWVRGTWNSCCRRRRTPQKNF